MIKTETRSGDPQKSSPRLGLFGFGLAIFSSAFLLFQIQPLIAKFILPWFGGGPGVWTTCMLFFQVFLLAGYAYAHFTTQHFKPRVQAGLHALLLAVALLFLPVIPGAHWKPDPATEPIGHILLLLTVCLGMPYFVLSSTGPLMQAWFTRLHPGAIPYRLYALSNAGSLLALVSFPVLFEPLLARKSLAHLWAFGFGGFALLCGFCAWRLWRADPESKLAEAEAAGGPTQATAGSAHEPQNAEVSPSPEPRSSRHEEAQSLSEKESQSLLTSAATVHGFQAQNPGLEDPPPTLRDKFLWFSLPACASVLLLAITNKMCLDVAAIPFLWVLPLSLYLLTFILCFDNPFWYFRKTFNLLLIPLVLFLCHALFGSRQPLGWQIGIYCASLFVACMVCHGEVYRLRPDPRFLTTFYLLIAAGGAAGGMFVAVVAPLVFRSYAELNWGIGLLGALLWSVHLTEKTGWTLRGRRWRIWPLLLAGVAGLTVYLVLEARRANEDVISMSRNFYGVLRVYEQNKNDPLNHVFVLWNGTTIHGLQFTDPLKAVIPTTYYNRQSGVGLALDNFPRQTNRRIGAVGLGTGTLAAYGRPGDTIRFYEINPEVKRLAETRFTYLTQCQAHVDVVPGDARLSLENEPPQQFDFLVLDAFSSDAIPVHLLTEQAFAIYLRQLKPDGVIAVHITNRHMDLFPVTRNLASHFNLGYAQITWSGDNGPWSFCTSRWVLLSRNHAFLQSEPIATVTDKVRTNSIATRLWTDDYISLFPILKPMGSVKPK